MTLQVIVIGDSWQTAVLPVLEYGVRCQLHDPSEPGRPTTLVEIELHRHARRSWSLNTRPRWVHKNTFKSSSSDEPLAFAAHIALKTQST